MQDSRVIADGGSAEGGSADSETIARQIAADVDAVGIVSSSKVFASYRPAHPVPGVAHPAEISEAASLAATPAPRSEYPLNALTDLIVQGRLSCLQVEAVQLACTRHLSLLPSNPPMRAGFFLGDGAGVGKGRTAAAILLDNLARGRSRHIWFSSSADLLTDAVRDLTDLGVHTAVHDGCQSLDRGANAGLGLSKELRDGILFSTYSALVSATSSQRARSSSRFDQLIEWCGGAGFCGCLVFDECHRAKGWTGKEETSSATAKAVIELQRALPSARVVYCSATGASDLSSLAYMERLGLWGAFSAFDTFEAFMEGVTRRGVGGLELLAMDLKASGAYVEIAAHL
jgi:hypothetical protein